MKEIIASADSLCLEKKYVEAIELYRRAAELGDAEAQYKLGKMLYSGKGVEKSTEEAMRLFRLSAEQGYESAEFRLGAAYQLGWDIEKDEGLAFYWYKRSAEHGNVKAMLYIGYYFETGYGTEISLPEAMTWWKSALEASEGKCCEAAYKLGHYYYVGVGGQRDLMKARYYFIIANKNGYECSGVIERVEKELDKKG